MKKIIMILIAIVSLSTGIVYSQHFVKFQQNITTEFYIDIDSVTVQKYEPPYYVIDVTYGAKNLGQQEIYAIRERFLYDYDRQEAKYILLAENHKDKYGNWTGWRDFSNQEASDVHDVHYKTLAYKLANLAFYKAYRIDFYK